MRLEPPRLASGLLARALHGDPAAPAILGDLREDFVRLARTRGAGPARRWYVREALLLAAGRIARRPFTTSNRTATMTDASTFRGILQDGRYALRALGRHPGFVVFTALVIGLGVGASTAVFTVLKPFLFAPLPFDDPGELVWIANEAAEGRTSLSAVTSRTSNLRDFRERSRSFDGLTGYNAFFDQDAYTLTGSGAPERLVGAGVADDFLDVLGVHPALGRDFTPEEGLWGGPPAIILSNGFWRSRFAADPDVVGETLELNGVARTVVGVLPASFDFSSVFSPGVDVHFLLPFPISDETDRSGNTLFMVGRLRPGASAETAQADLSAVVRGLEEAQPDRWGLGADVSPLQEEIARPFRPALLLLAAAAATLLLIVCVNVSNLLLARAPGRLREIAVRRAMGASRGRLMRQLVLESVGISVAGGALGAVLAWGATRAVSGTAGMRIPFLDRLQVDGTALLFATGVAVLTGLLVGLVPAFRVGEGDESAVLRAASRGSSASRADRRLRDGLVVAEVALACVLLVVGGLLVRSFRAVLDVDLGYDPADAVAWQLNPSTEFETVREASDFYRTVADRVVEEPGVEAVGLIDALPLGRNRSWTLRLPEEGPDREAHSMFPHLVDAGYFDAMEIPVVAGRGFERSDTEDSRLAVVMNASGARSLFGESDPLGRRVRLIGEEFEVVGIVEDVRHLSPEMDPGLQVYMPMAQIWAYGTMDMVVRSGLPVDEVAARVAGALGEIDPAMPTQEFWTLDGTVDRAVSARRFTLGILTLYGGVALFLAALGIYGVLAQSVAERKGELGIRMALGASSGQVVGDVMSRTLVLAGIGIVAGAALSLVGGRALEALLFGVAPTDPMTFVGTASILLVIAMAAAAVPAARAARIKGVRALQSE